MFKNKKKIFVSALTLISTALLTTSVTIPMSILSQKQSKQKRWVLMNERDWNNNQAFRFNNKDYLSIDNALNDFIKLNGGIKSESYVGELTKFEENGQVDIESNNFKPYDISKMYQAFMDANGRYTNDYNQALSSFVNIANLVSMFYDFKGNFFIDQDDAKSSMGAFTSMGLVFYNIIDYLGQNHKINPLNKKDQLKLKKIALDFLQQKNIDSNINNPFKLEVIRKQNINTKQIGDEIYSGGHESWVYTALNMPEYNGEHVWQWTARQILTSQQVPATEIQKPNDINSVNAVKTDDTSIPELYLLMLSISSTFMIWYTSKKFVKNI